MLRYLWRERTEIEKWQIVVICGTEIVVMLSLVVPGPDKRGT